MDRRNWMKLIGFGSMFGFTDQRARIPKFFYDWTNDTTDDPAWKERMHWDRGTHLRVLLDNKDGDWACSRFQTGERGWLEFVEIKLDGWPVEEWTNKETGEVIVIRNDKEYPLGFNYEKWSVELHRVRLHGKVEFIIDESKRS